MASDLTDIPFDHYQRYASAAAAVRAVLPEGGSVLEVGANRQRLLGAFLPGHALLYSDIEPQESPDFVLADACALPFAAGSHGAVVSLDVLEHIPAPLRRTAVAEMARVASRIVVICCPTDRPWVHEAEQTANAAWRAYMGGDYPWLVEHQEYGLVDPVEVEAVLRGCGLHVRRIGQGDPVLWSALMGAHFAKEAVTELGPLVAAFDRLYNRVVFPSDFGERGYRDIFIGVRHAGDLDAATAMASASPDPGDADARHVLATAAASLQPAVSRVLDAELQWRKTAELHADAERRLKQEGELRHQAGLELHAAELRAIEQFERAERADKAVQALDEAGKALERRAAEQFDRAEQADELARQAENRAVEQLRRADAADRRCSALESELAQSHEAIQRLERERDQVHGDLQRLASRAAGLERRQRWAVAGAGLCTVGVIVLLVLL